jgi:pyruvate/2-oxoglutarate/acetoin dehydrogenase E1 component
MEGELATNAGAVPIDRAIVHRPGRDVTLVAYGGTLAKALAAAAELAADGIEAEVIDLRTLRPLDTPALIESVARTHRAVIVDEGWRSGSISAEVSARLMEGAFHELDGPVQRVCAAEVPMPYARHLEEAALPRVETVVATVRRLVGGGGA